MRRRGLLLGGAGLVAARTQAQPMPPVGPVGGQPSGGGPLWSLNAGPPGLTLDLNFMTMGGVLDPRITFTRGSTATYFDNTGTMQSAAANAARFDYSPFTRTLNGLLIEEARTNVAPVSVPDNTNWSFTATTLTTGAATAPNGTSSASLLVDNATSSIHTTTSVGTFSFVSGTTYTFSVFAKAATAHGLQLYLAGAPFSAAPFANFDLSAGTVGLSSGSNSMQNCGNGWWRCSIVGVCSSSTSAVAACVVALNGNNSNLNRSAVYTGTGTGVYIWGAQTEAGAFPTSHIPTAGAAATRATDVATIASIPGRNATGESFNAETLILNTGPTPANPRVVGSTVNSVGPVFMQVTTQKGGAYDNASSQLTANTYTVGTVAKIATTWATPNTGRVCLNAGPVALSATQTNGYSAVTAFKFGGDGNAAVDQMTGYIRRFRYWPRVLTDAEMQQVTT